MKKITLRLGTTSKLEISGGSIVVSIEDKRYVMRNYIFSKKSFSNSEYILYNFKRTCCSNRNDLSNIDILYNCTNKKLNIECKDHKGEIVVKLKYFSDKNCSLSRLDNIFKEDSSDIVTSIEKTIDFSGCGLSSTLTISDCKVDYERCKISITIKGFDEKRGPFEREFDITDITIIRRPGSIETYYNFMGPKLENCTNMRSNSIYKDFLVVGFPGIGDLLLQLSDYEFDNLTKVLMSIEKIVKNFNSITWEV